MKTTSVTVEKLRHQVDIALSQFFEREKRGVSKLPLPIREILGHCEEFTLRGGKRLRPILVVLGYQGVGGGGLKEIMKAAIAVELMQSFLLIHDDIIDQDEQRRGKATIHKLMEEQMSKSTKESPHAGMSLGILAGDICAMLGTKAILESGFMSERINQAVAMFSTVALNTIYGEALDVHSSFSSTIDEGEITTIHHLKTALYTLDGPLQIGAVLGGASEQQQRIYSRYAIPLGRAFQIQDDILGVFGEEKALGKPVGGDLKEGKKTLLILKALEHANASERKVLARVLGNQEVTGNDIEKVKLIIERTGSLDYSQKMMRRLAERAKGEIKHRSISRETREMLVWLADYVVRREL